MGIAPLRSDPFSTGDLPSAYAEAATLPAVQRLLREQVGMQFADLRVLLRLPNELLAPQVGCNFTATEMILNQISGFSIWFFQNARRSASSAERQSAKAPLCPVLASRHSCVLTTREPQPSLPCAPSPMRSMRPEMSLCTTWAWDSSSPARAGARSHWSSRIHPLEASDIIDLEHQATFPAAGAPVQRVGSVLPAAHAGLVLGDRPHASSSLSRSAHTVRTASRAGCPGLAHPNDANLTRCAEPGPSPRSPRASPPRPQN